MSMPSALGAFALSAAAILNLSLPTCRSPLPVSLCKQMPASRQMPVPFSCTALFSRDPTAVHAGFTIQFFQHATQKVPGPLVSQCFHFSTQPSFQDWVGQVQMQLYRILTLSSLTLRPCGKFYSLRELLHLYRTFPLRNPLFFPTICVLSDVRFF